MECSCTVSSYESDGYWSERKLKAAKNHICVECEREIKKGEMFFFGTYIEPGVRINNSIVCLDCHSIQDVFFSDGWVVGSQIETLRDYFDGVWIDDLPTSCICKLTPRAKDMVCDILQEFQEV